MAEGKKSFVLYADQAGIFNKLPDDKAGQLIKMIFAYVNDKNPTPGDDLIMQLAFEPIMLQLKRDLRVWDEAKSKRSEAGKKGGRKSGEIRRKKAKNEANEAMLQNAKQNEATEAVNVNVTVTDNVNVTATVTETSATAAIKKIQDEFISNVLTDQLWCEERCMGYGLPDDGFATLRQWLEKYAIHARGLEKGQPNLSEFKKHFIFWMNKQGLNDKKQGIVTYVDGQAVKGNIHGHASNY